MSVWEQAKELENKYQSAVWSPIKNESILSLGKLRLRRNQVNSKYEVNIVQMDFLTPTSVIHYVGGKGIHGCFDTIDEAKKAITHLKSKITYNYPYVISDNTTEQLVYVEYRDYCLDEKTI